MKKRNILLFISTGALIAGLGAFAIHSTSSGKTARAGTKEPELINQTMAIDVVTSANNATAQFNANNYAIQAGDYLAIDIEGFNNFGVFKFGFNGTIVNSGADGVVFSSHSYDTDNWMVEMKWGYYTFANDGRGTFYVPINDYFPSLTNITHVNFLFADNKLESLTFHNIYVTKDTTADSGTNILDCFTAEGELDTAKVVLNDVSATARKSAKGFQTNKTLAGGVIISSPKTHIEIPVQGTITAEGGYFAYDISYDGGWVYFKTAYTNTSSESFNANYYAPGKSLTNNGTTTFNQVFTQYGFYNCGAVNGTILERAQTSNGVLSKIIIDCDNLPGGKRLIISNFYYISRDQKTVVPLVDLAAMSDEDFASSAVVTINNVSASISRVDPVQDWIDNYLYLGDERFNGEGTGLCRSGDYYLNAKIALADVEASRAGSISRFQNNTDDLYTNALNRYVAWAAACGDHSPFDGKTSISLF